MARIYKNKVSKMEKKTNANDKVYTSQTWQSHKLKRQLTAYKLSYMFESVLKFRLEYFI